MEAIAWPLNPGRDFGSYLTYFVQSLYGKPGYPNTMLWRTPITPFFIGLINRLGGVYMLETMMGVLFVLSIVYSFKIGRIFSRMTGWITLIILLSFPAYGNLYHQMSSDALFACAFLCWVYFALHTASRPRLSDFGWHGALVFLMIMIRPASQIFAGFAFYPFLFKNLSWPERIIRSGIFIVVLFFLITSYSTYNWMRYNHFGVTSGSSAYLPLKKLFVHYKLVKLDNGPATTAVAKAVKENLLDQEPYLSRHIDIKTAIENGGPRVLFDIKQMSDEVWGKGSNYSMLRRMAIETIVKNPIEFAKYILIVPDSKNSYKTG